MHRTAGGRLPNLLATAKTIGDNQSLLCGCANGRQECPLTASNRDLVMVARFEAKRAGHSAAAGFRNVDCEAKSIQNSLVVAKAHDRTVVAVSMHNGPAGCMGRCIAIDLLN